MGLKIGENTRKHVLNWDEDKKSMFLMEFQETTWNTSSQQYDIQLASTYKVGGADYINTYDTTSSSVTTIASSGTFYKLNLSATTTSSKGFTSTTGGTITKVGNAYGPIKIELITSLSSGNNNELMVAIYKNGSIISESESDIVTSSGGKASTAPVQCLTTLNDGDTIEVYLKNQTSSTNVELRHFNLILTEIL